MSLANYFVDNQLSTDAFKGLLPDFFKEIQADFLHLEEAAGEKDWCQVKLIAHKLKGTSASYGAYIVSEHARTVQKILEQDEAENVSFAIEQLGLAIKDTREFAQQHYSL